MNAPICAGTGAKLSCTASPDLHKTARLYYHLLTPRMERQKIVKNRLEGLHSLRAWEALSLILLTVSILISSYFLDVYQAAQYPRGYAYKSFLGSLGIFAFGVPAYFAYKQLSSLPERAKSWAAALTSAAAALALLLIVSFETRWIPVVGSRSHIWGVFFSLIIVSQCLKPSRIVSGKTLAWLGNLSFGLYLCHPPLISLLKPIYEALYRLPVWQGYSFLMCAALTLVLLIPLAYLAGRLIEKPFINLGERLVRARSNTPIEGTKPSVRDTAELSCTSKPEVLVH